jgi:hypothetical protein
VPSITMLKSSFMGEMEYWSVGLAHSRTCAV